MCIDSNGKFDRIAAVYHKRRGFLGHNICELNFCRVKLLWVRVVERYYHVANFLSVQVFVGIASPHKK